MGSPTFNTDRYGTSNTLAMVLAVISIAVVIFYGATRKWPDVPATQLAGRYHNPCCQDLVISGAYIQYGTDRVRFSVSNRKFGAVLTPDSPLGPFVFRNPQGASQPNIFLATMKGQRVSIAAIDGEGREHDFEKVASQRPTS